MKKITNFLNPARVTAKTKVDKADFIAGYCFGIVCGIIVTFILLHRIGIIK